MRTSMVLATNTPAPHRCQGHGAVISALALTLALAPFRASAQPAPAAPAGPPPTHADLEYAPADPPGSNGHKLDLYVPARAIASGAIPVVIWTGGSAWMADTGKASARGIAARLMPAGYAVAGVSIRSSAQVVFPGQLHDIKAAIRWLRANAATYGLDASRIAIMGDSSGGWTASMAALTGDAPELEGGVGVAGVRSDVRAAIAFYPPTDFLAMDAWAVRACTPPRCHDDATSPESRLVGCAIQTCAGKAQAANPVRYVTAADPPLLILHGGSDPLVPHNQGEQLYMALNKACRETTFISLPKAGHGPWNAFLTDDAVREAATIRTTSAAGCAVTNPVPYTPTWQTVVDFLDRHLAAK
jgi:acetyl esterase/lipase